ncbi:restriction endonuclease subunit S [Chryseobacterium sp. GVT01B]|uniref:restriction endonuclease subunit S n=1 Tax=Chryseobacterium sp. GVT01B TaxID=2862675 RepID=UPI001CBB20C1|nr:restriction endonuclease subunit S [Chryseobacterium sp. GVT01B]
MKEDWAECKIIDIAQILNGDRGKNYPSRAHYTKYGIPFISAGNITEKNSLNIETLNYISQERFELLRSGLLLKNDIIYCIRGSLGKYAIFNLESKGAISSSLMIIRNLHINNLFLYYYLGSPSVKYQISIFDNGTAQPNLAAKDFCKFKFPLPPLPEQRAIVKKIETLFSSLDAGIADLKKSQEQQKIYRQAVLKKAFEGELTNTKIIRKKFSEISSTIGDGLHGTPKYDIDGKYYFINGNNLNDGVIIIKPETKKVNETEYLKYKKGLNNLTVFVSINGTIGNTAFYNNEPIILGKSACYINLLEDIDKKYIHYHLKTTEFLNYALKNATGSTIKNVGLKTMREYLVPIPLLLENQQQIVKEIESRLSICDAVEKQIKNSLDQAEALRQSILKKAFEGSLLTEEELRACKAEPDYEPASVLLKRIKAEKEVHKPVKKISKKKVS